MMTRGAAIAVSIAVSIAASIPALINVALSLGMIAAPLGAQSAGDQSTTAQSTPSAEIQLKFDVASVKLNKSGNQPNSNFPLGPGDVYTPNGGFFSATDFPLITYISFAYKLAGNQLQSLQPQLPRWATTDRFDIQARAEGNPGKDQMRMMMRSLLADRFKLAIHHETREVPVLAFVLIKPGVTGPRLWPHPNDAKWSDADRAQLRRFCPTAPSSVPASDSASSPAETASAELPAGCKGTFGLSSSMRGRVRFAGRNVTIGFIADTFSAGVGFDRPMIDQTGLRGTFDYILEFTPEPRGAPPPASDSAPDDSVLAFQDALRDQLGIKLESKKGPLDVMIVDHVERPTEN
jgi:uncharacterized protein (TIGR03435 family)